MMALLSVVGVAVVVVVEVVEAPGEAVVVEAEELKMSLTTLLI